MVKTGVKPGVWRKREKGIEKQKKADFPICGLSFGRRVGECVRFSFGGMNRTDKGKEITRGRGKNFCQVIDIC